MILMIEYTINTSTLHRNYFYFVLLKLRLRNPKTRITTFGIYQLAFNLLARLWQSLAALINWFLWQIWQIC